jgi:hypothetical protein
MGAPGSVQDDRPVIRSATFRDGDEVGGGLGAHACRFGQLNIGAYRNDIVRISRFRKFTNTGSLRAALQAVTLPRLRACPHDFDQLREYFHALRWSEIAPLQIL